VNEEEQHHARMCKLVGWLREMRFSYEEIPDHLESPHHPRLEPWEVYGYANPAKSAAQVAAWKARHYPDAVKGSGGELRHGDFPATFTTR
jgi:hypothetical protein